MPLNPTQLSNDIQNALGGSAAPITGQISQIAQSICTHLESGILSNAPGTIVGVVPPAAGPLTLGAGTNGLIALVAASLVALFETSVGGSTSQITGFANAVTNSLLTSDVVFSVGSITGLTTNVPVPPTPGVLIGAGTGGMITALVDTALAAGIASGVMGIITPKISAMATAIVNHVMMNAVASYAPGSVTGVAPPTGGPLVAGAGTGGTIL